MEEGREISARAVKWVEEAESIAYDALFGRGRTLLMDGNGAFYSDNGNRVQNVDVLAWHIKMQEGLHKTHAKLVAAQTEIVALTAATPPSAPHLPTVNTSA